MAGSWPPPVGSRGRLNEPHPWAGHAGEVTKYELFQGGLALVVRLVDHAGLEAGVIDPEDFTALMDCPDCGVGPATPHEEGCDVARCTVCGGQRLLCEMTEGHAEGGGTTWTGEWPGEEGGPRGSRRRPQRPAA
jgi:hypothetical protein